MIAGSSIRSKINAEVSITDVAMAKFWFGTNDPKENKLKTLTRIRVV